MQPDTVLLAIRRDPPPTPTTIALAAQLDAARARAAMLDAALAQPPADSGDAGRLRLSEQHRLRDNTAAEIEQLQLALTTNTPKAPPDMPITAGVRGAVVSLDARSGARTAAGTSLAQLTDCGRAFLSLLPGGAACMPGRRSG